ncbi:MAG: hypothetical protein J6Y94_07710 [Bacteriovoracaceae bacterium]|nr:hypothetical protein [Bacteriovoracaceae bacterium]
MLLSMAAAAATGVTIGMFLAGVRCSDSLILARFKGVIRTALGFVTLPFFFIFDFPIIVRRRTFKEMITQSKLIYRSSMLRSTGLTVIMPLAVIFSIIYLPLLSDLNQSLHLRSNGVPVIAPISKGTKATLKSAWLKAEGTVKLPTYVLPHIVFHGPRPSVALTVFEPAEKIHFTVETIQITSFDKLLAPLSYLNPTSEILFPYLSDLLNHPPTVEQAKKPRPPVWNANLQKEAFQVLRCAWETHPPRLGQLSSLPFKDLNFVDRFLNCGVIYHGLAQIRDQMANELILPNVAQGETTTPDIEASFPQWDGKNGPNDVILLSLNQTPAEDYFILPFAARPPIWHVTSSSTTRVAAQGLMASWFTGLFFNNKIEIDNIATNILETPADQFNGIKMADFLLLSTTGRKKDICSSTLNGVIAWWKTTIGDLWPKLDRPEAKKALQHLLKLNANYYKKALPELGAAFEQLRSNIK